jgi:hypothetical protein
LLLLHLDARRFDDSSPFHDFVTQELGEIRAAVATTTVIDHDLLPESLSELLAHDAAERVRGASGGAGTMNRIGRTG